MSKNRKKKDASPQLAKDVLAGRVPATTADLVDLIHEINPTGRDLPAREAEARYALKSALQSLLIRRFPEEVTVRPEPGQDDVVFLDLRHGQRNACHVRLQALDEDARSWVRRRLDEEAAGSEDEAPARAPAAPLSVDEEAAQDDLAEGREAQEAYDYDTARLCYHRALVGSGGAPAPALALLALLVDCLAADEEALDLMPLLSGQALAHGEIRLYLALAAARCGRSAQALELLDLKAKGRPQTAEVLVILARGAVERGDPGAAEDLLAAARERDPAHPELPALREAILRHRSDARRPQEEAVEALLQAGRWDEAETEARALLARWPESEAARRVLRVVREGRRAREAEALLAQAEESLARGRYGAAMTLLNDALATEVGGALRARILDRLAEAEGRERAQQEAARVAAVVDSLGRGEVSEALHAYAGLAHPLRQQVQRRAEAGHQAVLHWLDEIERARPDAGARALCEAALALREAHRLLPSDPEAALAQLASHTRLLSPLPQHRQLTQEGAQLLLQRRREAARAALARARAALGAGELEQARQHLTLADLRALPEEEQAGAEELAAALRAAQERAHLESSFAQFQASGAHFAARAAVDRLIERSTGAEQARWQAARAAVSEAIQRAFHLWSAELAPATPVPPETTETAEAAAPTEAAIVDEADTPAAATEEERDPVPRPLCDIDTQILGAGGPMRAILPGTDRVVLAVSHGHLVFLRVVDFENYQDGEIRKLVVLRTPEPMGVRNVEVDDRHIYLLGQDGALLQLQHQQEGQAPVIVRWAAAVEITGPPDPSRVKFSQIQLAPGSRFLWMLPMCGLRMDKDGPTIRFGHARVVDLERPGVARDAGEREWAFPVPSREGAPMMACQRKRTVLGLYSPMGMLLHDVQVPGYVFHEAGIPHPSGKGVLAVCGPDRETSPDWADEALPEPDPPAQPEAMQAAEAVTLPADAGEVEAGAGADAGLEEEEDLNDERDCYVEISPQGVAGPPRRFPTRTQTWIGLRMSATALDHGMSFLGYDGISSERILALRSTPEGLVEAYAEDAPKDMLFLVDHESRRAFCAVHTEDGLSCDPLGPEPPDLPSWEQPYHTPLAELFEIRSCTACYLSDGELAQMRQIRARMSGRAMAEQAAAYREMIEESAADPERLILLYHVLEADLMPAEVRRLCELLQAIDPDNARGRMLRAGEMIRTRRWGEAHELLAGMETEGMAPALYQHHRHLLAMACLGLDQPEQAMELLEDGKKKEGRCFYHRLLDLARPLPEPLPDEMWDGEQPPLRQLIGAVCVADRRLADGDVKGAIDAIDRRVVWRYREPQSGARLAMAYLRLAEDGPAQRFRKGLALASYVEVHREMLQQPGKVVPLPRHTLDDGRLSEVSEAARGWLVENLGAP
jgi:hypothetical protein